MIKILEELFNREEAKYEEVNKLSDEDIETLKYIKSQFEKKGDKVIDISLKKGSFSNVDMFSISDNKYLTLIKYIKKLKVNNLEFLEDIYQQFDKIEKDKIKNLTIRKVLYIKTAIDEELKKFLIQIEGNIYKYKDMKIVVLV